jgi:glycosyltransferase involved in cell wall biosynthesis
MMNNLPDITIVIPTLNRPKRLLKAIQSIHDQNYLGLIKCVVVDSSKDDSSKIEIDNSIFKNSNFEIKYIKNNESRRPIDNWIVGIEQLDTPFSKFLCDDDWLDKNFLNICIEKLIKNNVDCVISNINVIKDKGNNIENYYKVKEGLVNKNEVVESFLGLSSILPVTPTASLFRTNVLKDSFYESLKHIECTEKLFGFDFFMSYYPVFLSKGTYLVSESLSSSLAGNDSMTLNVKKGMISYCYFFALINLIKKGKFSITKVQEKVIRHKLATFEIKSKFSKKYAILKIDHIYKPKLDLKKLLVSQAKKFYLKVYYLIKS